jgi:hypothetical protein
MKKMTKQDLQDSIVIVINTDGSHHVRLPADETVEFDRKAYNALVNTLLVLDQPSLILIMALYLERGMKWLSDFVSSLIKGGEDR